MIREAIQEAMKKPKDFFIYRARPNSRKWTFKAKRMDGYEGEFIHVTMNTEQFSIDFDGTPIVYVSGTYGVDWDNRWDWSDFGKESGERLSNMVKYMKEQE